MNQQQKHDINADARVWIYGLVSKLTEAEEKKFSDQLKNFVAKEWKSHQVVMPGYFEIRYHQFIVLVNQNQLSGCAIDASHHVVREMQLTISQPLGIAVSTPRLFYRDRLNQVKHLPRFQLADFLDKKLMTPDTTVFDPTISCWQDYQNRWEILARETWIFQK